MMRLKETPLFTSNIENVEDRSIMNVTFVMKEEYKEKEADFLAFATGKGNVRNQRTQVCGWIQGFHL